MKEKMMANSEQYSAVLDDLVKQRNQLQFRIGEIDAAVSALRKLMPEAEAVARKDFQQSLPMAKHGRYTGMSVRWAILALLAEDADVPMATGQIADALLAGGITSEGRHFGANVSAVLSKMNHERKEIVPSNSGWLISEEGKQVWIQIKASRERKQQSTPSASAILQ